MYVVVTRSSMHNMSAMKNTSISCEAATERTYSGISMSERIALRRQRFIEAGISLFGTVGFQSTTMRMLTAQTELTNRYFYESFTNLEDLLVACYEKLMDDFRLRLEEELERASKYSEPSQRIRPGLNCFFTSMADPKFARITHAEVLGVSERVDRLYSRCSADFAALMMSYLTSSVSDKKQLSDTQMQFIGAALTGSLINSALVWVNSQYEASIDDVIDASLAIFNGTVNQLRLA
ncbi:MAG: hypothetical protein CL600_02680 [Alteromonas sp.]|nr:hypothetical protein [Alteromonas sp.]